MADITLRQQSPQLPIDPNKIVTNLYECCLQLFLSFVKHPVPELDPSIQRRLHTQAQKFKLWGVSFNVREGELDRKIIGADRLRNSLLPILSGLGETLVTLALKLNKAEELDDTCSQFQLLKVLVFEVTTSSSQDNNDAFPEISLDELGSLESEDSSVDEKAEIEDLLRDTQSYNDCLFGLSSVLEDPAEKAIPGFNASQSLEASNQELLKNSAWPYIKSVIEAYPYIDRMFARRLGEANANRYARLQARRDRAHIRPTDLRPTDADNEDLPEGIVQEVQPSESHDRVLSGFTATTRFSYEKKPRARIAASVTNFFDNVLKEDSRKRGRGIPKMPGDRPWGIPFSCTVCGDYLEKVWSSEQWVRHVYRDLQPYICPFADCSSSTRTFVSKREWENHDLTKHCEEQPEDQIRTSQGTCSFCQILIAGPKSHFISHLGRHMRDISHAAIPMSARTHDHGDLELSDADDITADDSIDSIHGVAPDSVFIAPSGFRPNSVFVGREQEIRQLNKLLFDERPPGWNGAVSVLLYGMTGVGTTQIAREFAFKNRERFKGGVFWIPAQSQELVYYSLIRLMRKLAISDEFGVMRSVNTWLGQRQNWLLVFDGLPEANGGTAELSKLAPDSKDSCIIYVARSRDFSSSQWQITFKIEPLGEEASQHLLFRELDIDKGNERQRAKATEIVRSVGCLPLAINTLARHLRDTNQPLETFEF